MLLTEAGHRVSEATPPEETAAWLRPVRRTHKRGMTSGERE